MTKEHGKFIDSLLDMYNGLVNSRNPLRNNVVYHNRVDPQELRAIYKTGLGSKIVRIKAGYSLKDSLSFESTNEEKLYKERYEKAVKNAARFMIGFGRGIIVLFNPGDDLSKPMRSTFDPLTVKMRVFSGDMVTATSTSQDLMSPRYYKPEYYSVRGAQFHHSRVVDFTYVEPVEFDAPIYQYGGISEFELIYNQIVNDSIVERATPTILEKNSTLFYKVEGFKAAMQDGRDAPMREYFRQLENARSIFGAGLLDSEDDAFTVTQALTNLQEADSITLRRLAMVTGIPLAVLVGENVKGLNSTGDNEMLIFNDMIQTLQSDYLEDPINELATKLGMQRIYFAVNQGRSPDQQIEYETRALQNAQILFQLGEDHLEYLRDRDIIKKDNFKDFFEETETPADTIVN